MQSTTIRPAMVYAFSTAVLAFVIGSPVFAASVCKGLDQELCETSEGCRWQAGYTRKDGIDVASHCRSTGKKKEVTPEASTEADTEQTS
jgi:hypothetical protein